MVGARHLRRTRSHPPLNAKGFHVRWDDRAEIQNSKLKTENSDIVGEVDLDGDPG